MNNNDKMRKSERLGQIRKNKESLGGYEMKIVEYKNSDNIVVEFQDRHKARVRTRYHHFEIGNVKNPYNRTVYGVGYLGQGKYKTKIDCKSTRMYEEWKMMLRRCYDPYTINKDKGLAYKDVFVCEEWHCFQNFAKWWKENVYNCNNEKIHLDKDILIKGNKIYSPETCVLVPERINRLFINMNKARNRGEYPIGVSKRKEKSSLIVVCRTNQGKSEYLGDFPLNRPFQAFYAYKTFKENYIKQVADEYKDLIPEKLYKALYKYEVEIND